MIRIPQIAGLAAILSLGLFVVLPALPPFGGDAQAAAEQAPASEGTAPEAEEGSAGIGLAVEDGKVTGKIAGQPLKAVLGALIEDPAVVPKIPSRLASHPVSGRFDAVPLKEAIERILAPFDHVLILGPDDAPTTIVVMGLRDSGDAAAQAGGITGAQDEGAAPPQDVMADQALMEPGAPEDDLAGGLDPVAEAAREAEQAEELRRTLNSLESVALFAPEDGVRGEALGTLAQYRHEGAAAILIEAAASDPEPGNRMQAVQALWHSAADGVDGTGAIAAALKAALDDPDENIAALAAQAIEDLEAMKEAK